jgi:sensor histidine kinase YesM
MQSIKKAVLFFWIFIFLLIFLQLANDKDVPTIVAFTYSLCIVLTLKIYIQYVVNKLIERYLRKNAAIKFFIIAFLTSAVNALFLTLQGYFLINTFSANKTMVLGEFVAFFFGMLVFTILFCGVSYSIEMFKQKLEAEKKHQELRNNVLEMEMEHLRTQLSPHFTFNILNNLQFLIRKDKQEALDLLSKYSKILRYYVYESRNKWIRLDDEVAFLKDYFQLEQDRSGDNLKISCQWNIPENNLMVIPFVLSTFVENAFKHVSNFDDQINYIHLHVFLEDDSKLFLKIENSTDLSNSGHSIHSDNEGVGLKYVQKRLDLSYGKNYKLEQISDGKKYKVELYLNLEENEMYRDR